MSFECSDDLDRLALPHLDQRRLERVAGGRDLDALRGSPRRRARRARCGSGGQQPARAGQPRDGRHCADLQASLRFTPEQRACRSGAHVESGTCEALAARRLTRAVSGYARRKLAAAQSVAASISSTSSCGVDLVADELQARRQLGHVEAAGRAAGQVEAELLELVLGHAHGARAGARARAAPWRSPPRGPRSTSSWRSKRRRSCAWLARSSALAAPRRPRPPARRARGRRSAPRGRPAARRARAVSFRIPSTSASSRGVSRPPRCSMQRPHPRRLLRDRRRLAGSGRGRAGAAAFARRAAGSAAPAPPSSRPPPEQAPRPRALRREPACRRTAPQMAIQNGQMALGRVHHDARR